MALKDKLAPIPAAKELLEFIGDEPVPSFCERKGLDRFKLARLVKGEILRVDVDFAFELERATDGHLPAERWCMTDDVRDAVRAFRRAQELKAS